MIRKYLIFVFMPFLMLSAGGASLEGISGEIDRISHWEKVMTTADSLDKKRSEEQISLLASVLRGIDDPSRYSLAARPRAEKTYRDAQQKLLSIPGHAVYFAEELEKQRNKAQNVPRSNQLEYDRWREWNIAQVFCHVPSPEAVVFLGGLLDDVRDVPPSRQYLPENAYLAAFALSNIKLRESPFPPIGDYVAIRSNPEWKESLPLFRQWFSEIKSGKRVLSFVGRKDAYRFQPNGVWESVLISNPSDDSPSATPLGSRPEKKGDYAVPVQDQNFARLGRWAFWSGIILAATLLAICCIRWFRREH